MVVKVIVKDVVKSREICLNYTDSNDLGIQCSIQDLREKCAEHWCEEGMDESAYAHGLFIYQHAMLYDNQEKLFVSKASTVVVYFLATAFPLPNEHKVHFTIDEVSMKAASEWLNVGSEQVVNPVTSQLVMALQKPELIAHAEAAPANVAPVAPVVAPVVPPAAPVNWLEVLQLRKLVQLVFFYFVFTYNRPYSDKKKLFIALTMLFVYLIQVGLFKWLFKRFCDQFNKVENNVAAIPPAANGDNNVPLNQPVNPLPVSPLQRVVNIMQSLSQHGIRIPRTQGIILDMYSLVVALVGSIFPGWQPLAAVV